MGISVPSAPNDDVASLIFPHPDVSDWYEFGKFLSDTFAGLLKKIPWEELQEKARTLASNVADFVNGIFQPENFAVLGQTIAEGLNTAFTYFFTLGQGIDFENIGVSFAEAINNFFLTFDFKQAGAAIHTWIQGLWTAIKTALKGNSEGEGGIDWPLVREKFAEFFSEFEIQDLGLIIGYLQIKKILKISVLASAGKSLMKALGLALSNGLKGVYGYMVLGDSEAGELLFGKNFGFRLARWIASAVSSIGTAWASLGGLGGMMTMDLGVIFGAGTATEIGLTLGAGILGGIAAFFGGTTAGTALGKGLSMLFGEDEGTYDKYLGLKGVIPLVKDLGLAIKDFFNPEIFKETSVYDFFVKIGEGVKSAWESITTWLGDAKYAITMMFEDAKNAVLNVWTTISTWFQTYVIQPVVDAFTAFSEWWSGIVAWFGAIFQDLWIVIKAVWLEVAAWFDTNVLQPIRDGFSAAWDFISNLVTGVVNYIKKGWEFLTDWFNDSIIEPLKNLFAGFISFATVIWSHLWEDIKRVWGAAVSWFGTIINGIKDKFNFALDAIKLLWSNLIDDIKSLWTAVVSWIDTEIIQRISGLFSTLWGNITQGVKDALNFAIGIVEDFINYVIDAINGFTSGLTALASKASLLTGDSYGTISQISHVELPRLAKGAVIPPNHEFAAILGDQRHGTNIEAPLDTIVQAFKTALNDNDSNAIMTLMAQQVQLLQIIAEKEFGISERQIFNSVKKSANEYTKMTGQTAF